MVQAENRTVIENPEQPQFEKIVCEGESRQENGQVISESECTFELAEDFK